MTKNEELLLRLNVFKVITEYQIKWLSTSYEIPNVNYTVITSAFPQFNMSQAVALLNEWVQYETTNLNINVYNKVRFDEYSNIDTIIKLNSVVKQLNENIETVKQLIEKENPTPVNPESKTIEITKNETGITITFLNPSWFKKNNVINLTFDAAKELSEKLKAIL